MFDYETAIRSPQTLHHAASAPEGWHKDQAAEFIKVGGYGLALDGIAYEYVVNRVKMPEKLFHLVDELAAAMELDRDPEYDGVARLRHFRGTST